MRGGCNYLWYAQISMEASWPKDFLFLEWHWFLLANHITIQNCWQLLIFYHFGNFLIFVLAMNCLLLKGSHFYLLNTIRPHSADYKVEYLWNSCFWLTNMKKNQKYKNAYLLWKKYKSHINILIFSNFLFLNRSTTVDFKLWKYLFILLHSQILNFEYSISVDCRPLYYGRWQSEIFLPFMNFIPFPMVHVKWYSAHNSCTHTLVSWIFLETCPMKMRLGQKASFRDSIKWSKF